MFGKTLLLVLFVVVFVGMPLLAGNDYADDKPKDVTLKGTLVCLGCDLKKSEGARAACSVYGHNHALKMEDGHYISFLPNQYSADLLKGEKFHNKKVTVHGTRFANANLIDVEWYEVDGKKKGWCGRCKSMDGCAFR